MMSYSIKKKQNMIIEQLRNLLILVISCCRSVINMVWKSNNPICPDDFKDPKQEIASFEKWANDFYDKNPSASIAEMSKARVNFWTDNNCKEALQRVKDYESGKVDKETQQLIEMTIREEMIKNKRTPICPDEYENEEDYLKDVEQWLGDFYDKNPNTTKDEILSARKNFLLENGCKELSIL